MGALTPEFLYKLEYNMRVIQDNEYTRMASKLWYLDITKTMPSGSEKEILTWLLSTAQIENTGKLGGNLTFDDLVTVKAEFTNQTAGTAFKMHRNQFEDLDGKGMDLSGQWAAQMGAYMAYWPQKQIVRALLNGEADLCFDGKPFFATDHPYNPHRLEVGEFSNLFTDLPIDDSVTVEVAFQNLAEAVNRVRSIKMPNGVDPRFLSTSFLIVPPALQQRAVLLTGAKFITTSGVGGAGSTDVSPVLSSFGWKAPIVADELAPLPSDDAPTIADKNATYYISSEQIASSQIGAFVYVDREPFKITYYTGQGGGTGVDAILDRARELEWHVQGRNVAGPGLPYLMFKQRPA